MKKEDTVEVRFKKQCGVAKKKGIIAIALFYALAALFNAQGLLKRATLMEYDAPMRTTCLSLAKPLAKLSHFLRTDRMRSWIENNIKLEEIKND